MPSWVLTGVVFGPMLAAALLPVLYRKLLQDTFAVVVTGLTLAGVVTLAPAVLQGQLPTASLPGLLGRFNFAVDRFGLLFALVGSFVWFAAMLYAIGYLREDPARVRFLSILLVLLGANLGVVLAADLLTLFVFFELLGLVALLVIVHTGSDEARAAGVKYFWMTFGGGLALLAGIVVVVMQSGSLVWAPLPEAVGSGWRWTIFGLLLIGFGVKAGMVPLHIWLPAAHPVAPAPASALLSGVMIKAGAYGLFRSLDMLVRPEGGAAAWNEVVDMGMVLAMLGILTMATGVVMALLQDSVKRMLAWSSVSQIGFVLTGLGVGALLAADGAMASAGALLHVVNHALFKSCLFLAAGAIALRCGSADMGQLGGLWRRMPVTFGCVLVATAGITGIPLFNGSVSKNMIHHGLVEASQRPGGEILVYAEWVYLAVAAGTIAYFSRFIYRVFLRRAPQQQALESGREASPAMLTGLLLPVAPILWLGLYPHEILQTLIAPGLENQGLSPAPVSHYLEHYFLSGKDLLAFAGMLAGGLAVAGIGARYGLFRRQPPAILGVDFWYGEFARGLIQACHRMAAKAADLRNAIPAFLRQLLLSYIRPAWDQVRIIRHRLWQGLLLGIRAATEFFLKGGMLRRRVWRDLLLRVRAVVEFLIDTTLRDHVTPHLSPPDSKELEKDRLYAALDQQRDRLILAADRLARKRDEEHPGDALINASHMLAGWIGTELLERAMASGGQHAHELAGSERLCTELAERSVTLARRYLDSQLSQRELDQVAQELSELLGPDLESPDMAWPERSWPAEITAIALAPDRGHWPVSESLEQGAFVSAARGRIMKVARDLSSGLLVAFLILLGLALGARVLMP